jgi:hypothetical protein
MNLLPIFADWMQTLLSPVRFFDDQEGHQGLRPPLAFLLFCTAATLLLTFVPVLPVLLPGLPVIAAMVAVPLLAVGLAAAGLIVTLASFVWAGLVHGICRMLGGQGTYSGSFRATTYALAPVPIFHVVSALVMLFAMPQLPPGLGPPGAASRGNASEPARLFVSPSGRVSVSPRAMADDRAFALSGREGPRGLSSLPAGGFPRRDTSPLGLFLGLLATGVYFAFMGIGVSRIHGLSPGAAAGVALLSGVTSAVLLGVFVSTLSGGIAALAAGAPAVTG